MFAGCRDPLVPNFEDNLPPETWITAAPQDTITTKDPSGVVIPPQVGTIPVIFHLYWAGSDADGEVTGYYFAVVETTTAIPVGGIRPPRLPGPKPQDYRFTMRTDSVFIFNVAEFSPDREHAFYIYAVDDKGRPDPTPARFIFNSIDRYPPLVVFDEASATGRVFRQGPGGTLFTKDTTYALTDTLNPQAITKEFVPVGASLTFRWHTELRSPLLVPVEFKYKLDETNFVSVDSSVRRVDYERNATGPGQKIFTLKALDQAGGSRTPPSTRRFGLNLPPDTWWSGPDPNSPFWSSRPRHGGTTAQLKYRQVSNYAALPPIPGSLVNCDSVSVLPSQRPFRPTFLEIWKDTIYVRSEGDTVHLNSWLIFSNGGFDEDSPYSVKVSPIDPDLPDTVACGGAVFRPASANGSPIGFRGFLGTFLDPIGPFSAPSVSGVYPLFDPVDFRRIPQVNGYQKAILSGRGYAVVRAEDGTGQDLGGLDRAIPSNVNSWVSRVDQSGSAAERLDRTKKVLTFMVNYDPFLLTSAPTFSPKLAPPGRRDTLATRQVSLNLLADDIDPLDPVVLQPPVGGPTGSKVFRFTVRFTGRNAANRDTLISPPDLFRLSTVNVPSYPIPSAIVSDTLSVFVELCDCRECELQAGKGRCITQRFPLYAPPPPVARTTAQAAHTRSGPGSSEAMSGGHRP